MSSQRPDRRVRRTKGRLKATLLELIDEQDYDAITIEDITERAGVGRSTFYSHFTSKDDLLFSGFDHWLLSLTGTEPNSGDEDGPDDERRFRFSLPLLQHIRSQVRFFQATIVQGSNAGIRRRITALLAQPVRVELERMSSLEGTATRKPGCRNDEAELLREAQAHAVVGAFLGLVAWWVNDAPRLSAEMVDQVFQRLVT
ncbi:MAG: TetR/AcrR family transcriptional regulator [Gemmatimonadetes bacterium]|nr:TetR/AcrR family transcriptional regulator [Gemmatimonadota bacterium]